MLNPIEEMFSLWKNEFRKLRIKYKHFQVYKLNIESATAISADKIHSYFLHSIGYYLNALNLQSIP